MEYARKPDYCSHRSFSLVTSRDSFVRVRYRASSIRKNASLDQRVPHHTASSLVRLPLLMDYICLPPHRQHMSTCCLCSQRSTSQALWGLHRQFTEAQYSEGPRFESSSGNRLSWYFYPDDGSETLVTTYKTTMSHNPEAHARHIHRRESLKSHKFSSHLQRFCKRLT
jgi:hypothetical protein